LWVWWVGKFELGFYGDLVWDRGLNLEWTGYILDILFTGHVQAKKGHEGQKGL
jgi:hypothetical protein